MLKCKGSDVYSYISKLEVLTTWGLIYDDGGKVDLFNKVIDEDSPHWDKLTRPREKQVTFPELVEGLTQCYASIVNTKMPTKDEKLDDEDDDTPKSTKGKNRKLQKKEERGGKEAEDPSDSP